MVDEALVEEACKVTGEKTWSGAINYALKEVIRRNKARGILALAGTDFWEGDLGEMRGDDPWRPARTSIDQPIPQITEPRPVRARMVAEPRHEPKPEPKPKSGKRGRGSR